jgi:hypothetical protein
MKTTTFIFLGLLAATSVLAQKPNEASKPREIPPKCSSEQTMVDHGLQREWRLIG